MGGKRLTEDEKKRRELKKEAEKARKAIERKKIADERKAEHLENSKDRAVKRKYIPIKSEDANKHILYATDAETGRLVHISKAFNGNSHHYYVEEGNIKADVMAYQGEELGWHYKLVNEDDRKRINIENWNSGLKHKKAVEIIAKLGCIKVGALTFASDIALTTDFVGFERDVYLNTYLYEPCTLIADKVNAETMDGPYRPDVMFYVGDKKYAIEVIDTHGLWPHQKDGLAKVQYYYDNDIDIIAVYINNLTLDDVMDGKFVGKWYLSSYARRCMETLYFMCKHSYAKDAFGQIVDNFDDCTTVCNCQQILASAKEYNIIDGNNNIDKLTCKRCQENSRGLYFAFRDSDRLPGEHKRYFYDYIPTKSNSGNMCIHCFKYKDFKKFRCGGDLTLANYITRFKTEFGHNYSEFDRIFKEVQCAKIR